jgi:hypothetical protein
MQPIMRAGGVVAGVDLGIRCPAALIRPHDAGEARPVCSASSKEDMQRRAPWPRGVQLGRTNAGLEGLEAGYHGSLAITPLSE